MLLYREHQKEWSLETVIGQITQDLEAGKKAEQLTRTEEKTMQKAEAFFETARIRVNERFCSFWGGIGISNLEYSEIQYRL